jgi:molecular chaperone Hsp33
MNNKDILQKFLFENAPVRGEIVRLHHSFQTIRQQHAYPSAVQQLLGEALVVVNLLSAIIKFKGRLTVQFKGQDKLKLLLTQCDHEFNFRGLAQWQGDPDYIELINALRQGPLAITIEPTGAGKQRYQGIVEWQGNSLAQSIEGYFKNSEQLPTRLWLAVNETDAVGLLLQSMPDQHSVSYTDDWEHIISLAETIKPTELLECDNATLLHRLYHQEAVRLFDPIPVNFKCNCSQKRSENALLLLGEEEANQELTAKQQLVVVCDFCNTPYIFDRVDVAKLFKNQNDSPGQQVH